MIGIIAAIYRRRFRKEFVHPNPNLGVIENLVYMMDFNGDANYKPAKEVVKALNAWNIVLAEHELNSSTAAIRHVASTDADIYSCMAGALATVIGRRHGGAN